MGKWTLVNTDGEYIDFDRELYSMPDEGNTSVDMRLTFNVETRTCYYTISLKNDSGNTQDWEKDHHLPWAVGLAVLGNVVELPEELK
jgi:hypothetical protein